MLRQVRVFMATYQRLNVASYTENGSDSVFDIEPLSITGVNFNVSVSYQQLFYHVFMDIFHRATCFMMIFSNSLIIILFYE